MPGRRKINGSGKTSRCGPDVFRKRSGIGKTYPEKGRKIVKNGKTVNGGIRRTKTGREAGPEDREAEKRKSGKLGWEGKIRNGRNRKVETEKKEKDNSPCGGRQERRSGPAGPARRRGKRKNGGDVGAARTGSKNGC